MTFQILAHRGGMARAPENTLAAFKQALADGADAYECDVCLTRDKEPVLIHIDFNRDSVLKATGCNTPLSELMWEDVQQLTSENSDEPVAHLDDALQFTRENQIPCFIEPKSNAQELMAIIVERIRKFEVIDEAGILTFSWRKQLLVQAKKLEPKLQTSAIHINPMENFVNAANTINADRIILGWSRLNHFKPFTNSIRQKIHQLKENDIVVEAGFIRTSKDVAWAVDVQIDGLWADDIPYIRQCLQNL